MTRRIPKNYAAARQLSDQARARAFARIDALREREAHHRAAQLQLSKSVRRELLNTPLDVAVDQRVNADPQFQAAVADNRWWMNTATMYAQQEIIERLDVIILLLTQLTTPDITSDEARGEARK